MNGSKLLGHPIMNKLLGIEFSTGSLGMGLALGVGVALAGKRKKNLIHMLLLEMVSVTKVQFGVHTLCRVILN